MCRSARTNITRLRPYPKKPTTKDLSIALYCGKLIFNMKKDIRRLVDPAIKPLIEAIWKGSPPDIFFVRLLSMAHERHAITIASGPVSDRKAVLPFYESTALPAVIKSIPTAILLSKFSMNTNHAIRAVKTPSRFSSSEAVEA